MEEEMPTLYLTTSCTVRSVYTMFIVTFTAILLNQINCWCALCVEGILVGMGGVMLVGRHPHHSVGKGWNPGCRQRGLSERGRESLWSAGSGRPVGKMLTACPLGRGAPDPSSSEGTTDW